MLTGAAPLRWLAPAWGLLGVLALLASAVWRLTPVALAPVRRGLSSWELALYAASILFFGYSEGYRAFQRAFSPRVVARARHLAGRPPWLHAVLAPLFCMALFHARRRRLVASWGVVIGVVGLVLLVRRLPQPYRGAIDAGVVVALLWGMAAIAVYARRAAAGQSLPVPPDLT